MASELISVPAELLRGGTSKGVFLLEGDLPADRSLWGPYLIELMGGRSPRAVAGISGGDPPTSKVCILDRSDHPDVDIVFTFAQIALGQERVMWDLNCGNLSATVGVFAIRSGLVEARQPSTTVRVFQANTNSVMRVEVPVGPDGPRVDGDFVLEGVPGSGAPVWIDFSATTGASLDRGIFPTGNRTDVLDVAGHGPVECSIVDVANASVFFRPQDIGFTGTERIEQGPEMLPGYAAIRRAAQRRLEMDASSWTPWPVSVTAATEYTLSDGTLQRADACDIVVRFVNQPPRAMHQAHPATGLACVAAAAELEGTVVSAILREQSRRVNSGYRTIGHPSGAVKIRTDVTDVDGLPRLDDLSIARTWNPLLSGTAFVRKSEIDGLVSRLAPDSSTRAGVPPRRGY
jgi:2-methylaconitate cis-trans-isomerase PrpF